MRRLIGIALSLLTLGWAGISEAAFGTLIQSKVSSTATCVLDSSPTAGNLLTFEHHDLGGDTTPGSGMTSAVEILNTNATDELGLHYRIVQGGDGTSWTVGTSGGANLFVCREWEGPFDATPLDVTASTTVTIAPATKSSGTTGTTAVATSLAIASLSQRDVTVTVTSWSNSFTGAAQAVDANSSINTAYKVLSATGAQETTATMSAAAGQMVGLIAVFKGTGGGGGPSCRGALLLMGVGAC